MSTTVFTILRPALVLLLASHLIPVRGPTSFAPETFGQSLNVEAIEKQQRQLSQQVSTLHLNYLNFWIDAYPHGAPFATRDASNERKAAWSPKFEPPPKGVISLNDGLGCVMFITQSKTEGIPDICAPVDVRAGLAMEALREDWENSRNVPGKYVMLISIREAIPALWSEEKALYCVLRPEAQYIDLDDKLKHCTPTENH